MIAPARLLPIILNSRPAEYRARFHAAFGAAMGDGWRIVDCPVLAAEPVTAALPASDAVDLLIFTSQTAVALFPPAPSWRGIKALAVGEATAEAARAKCFNQVVEAGQDVADLRRYLADSGFRAGLYPSAADVTADLAREFPGRVQRAVIYRMVPRSTLGAEFLASGWVKVPVIAPLFSRRSAMVLAELLEKALLNMAVVDADIAAVGISADALAEGPWRTRAVADEPTLAAVAAATRRLADRITRSAIGHS